MTLADRGDLMKSDIYDDGCLRVEHQKFYVACDGIPLYDLTPKEFQILSRLVREIGRPVPQSEIWASVWGDKGGFDENADNMLRVYISALRRKLKRFGLLILAKPNVGYVLYTMDCVCMGQKGKTQ